MRSGVERGTGNAVEQVTLAVSGMHCGGCASRVEGRLLALPGVHSADADLGTGLVRVELDPSTTRPGTLAEALTAAGYPTTVTG